MLSGRGGDLSGLYGSPGAQALFRKSSNAAYKRPAEIGEGSAVLLADQRRVLATRGIPRAILPSVSSARPTAPAAPMHKHWLASFYPGGALTFGIVVRTARREGYCPGSIFGFLAVIAF